MTWASSIMYIVYMNKRNIPKELERIGEILSIALHNNKNGIKNSKALNYEYNKLCWANDIDPNFRLKTGKKLIDGKQIKRNLNRAVKKSL